MTKKIRQPSSTETKSKDLGSNFLIQVLVFFLCIVLVNVMLKKNPGYKWAYETLLLANWKTQQQYRDISTEEKYQAKLGYNYAFLNEVNKRTPENAIIIMPPSEAIFPENRKSNFTDRNRKYSIENKVWSSYFVYPRKLVYEYEKDTNPLYKQATHVAIVNGWGTDKLKYPVQGQMQDNILPIEKAPQP